MDSTDAVEILVDPRGDAGAFGKDDVVGRPLGRSGGQPVELEEVEQRGARMGAGTSPEDPVGFGMDVEDQIRKGQVVEVVDDLVVWQHGKIDAAGEIGRAHV